MIFYSFKLDYNNTFKPIYLLFFMNKKRVLTIFVSFIFLILLVSFVSAGLCKGSDGYYHDCSNDGSSYRKAPVKTAVQTYNKGYYKGQYEGYQKGYKKGYGNGYDNGYDERRKRS